MGSSPTLPNTERCHRGGYLQPLGHRVCLLGPPVDPPSARRDCAKGPMGRDGAGLATAMRGLLHARKGARGAAIDGLRLAMLAAPQQDGAQQGVLYCVSAVSQKRAFSVAISVRLYPIIRVATLLVQCTREPVWVNVGFKTDFRPKIKENTPTPLTHLSKRARPNFCELG